MFRPAPRLTPAAAEKSKAEEGGSVVEGDSLEAMAGAGYLPFTADFNLSKTHSHVVRALLVVLVVSGQGYGAICCGSPTFAFASLPASARGKFSKACSGRYKMRREPCLQRGLLLLRASGGSNDDDILGQDFPRYNNVPENDESSVDGAPRFIEKKGSSSAESSGWEFDGVASKRKLPSFTEEDMSEGLKERIFYVMLDAFDNYPPQEVSRMLDLLWEAGPDAGPTRSSLRQLVQLTAEVEAIAEASRVRSSIPGQLSLSPPWHSDKKADVPNPVSTSYHERMMIRSRRFAI